MPMINLRKKLDEIIHKDNGNNWWKPCLFKKHTQKIIPKELKILEPPPSSNENYNCFIHILGLSHDSNLIKDCSGFIYSALFQKLLDDKILTCTDNPQKGDYIIYHDLKNYPKIITHAGIIENKDTIISKWAWGPLFRHKIFDVPESYGNNVSYVKSISKERAKELYKKYKKFNKK